MNGVLFNISMQMSCILLVYFVARKQKINIKTSLGLILPKLKDTLFWFALFIVLIGIESFISDQNGSQPVESWIEKYSTAQICLRIFAIAILAPISEEILFRGLIYFKIKKTRLKNIGAIVIPAIIFALIHIQYSEILSLCIIFIDGIFYGLARHFSKSVILAIMLHSYSNIGAIIERLT